MRGETREYERILLRSAWAALLTSLRQPNTWQDPQIISDAILKVRGIGRFALRASSDDLYHVLPSRESAVLTAIRNTLREGSLFIDAGANIGFYTLVGARAVGASGKVYAVEMMPDTIERLRQTIRINNIADRVTVLPYAIGETSGELVVASVAAGKFGQASIARTPAQGNRTFNLRSKALDELVPADKPIHLIKLDLEGGELQALKGARRTLDRTQTVIFEQLGSDCEVADFLNGLGFSIRRLDPNNLIGERYRGV